MYYMIEISRYIRDDVVEGAWVEVQRKYRYAGEMVKRGCFDVADVFLGSGCCRVKKIDIYVWARYASCVVTVPEPNIGHFFTCYICQIIPIYVPYSKNIIYGRDTGVVWEIVWPIFGCGAMSHILPIYCQYYARTMDDILSATKLFFTRVICQF